MRMARFFKASAVVLAVVGWILPLRESTAAGPRPRATQDFSSGSPTQIVRDIALGQRGRLTGQVVDAQGNPLARQAIVVQQPGSETRQVASDDHGRFLVEGLQGGVYQVSTDQSSAVCRCWVSSTAPPAASDQLLLVSDSSVQRGQRPIGELLFSAPVLIGLVIAAAIAIPIAIHNSKKEAS